MSNLPVYNQEGQEVGTARLPKEIFDVKINNDLVYQAVNVQSANRRIHLAKTKDRSEVRGGGKKPWRQKGTGRSRHGSTRSPLWVGGGVTFGPIAEKVFERKINKKARRKALFMVLSSKVQDKELIIVEDLKLEAKTRKLADLLKKIIKSEKKYSVLIIVPGKDEKILKAVRNIGFARPIAADSLNVLDLLSSKYLLMPKESIKIIEKTYSLKSKTEETEEK